MRFRALGAAILLLTACERTEQGGRSNGPRAARAPAAQPEAPDLVAPATCPAGTIRGRVTVAVPREGSRIRVATDCTDLYEGPVYDPLTRTNGVHVRYALVEVQGLDRRDFEVAPEARLVQRACLYEPAVLGVVAGQTMAVEHDDDNFVHNFHIRTRRNGEHNINTTSRGQVDRSIRLEMPEGPVAANCDVHSWMRMYVVVLRHPKFAISGEDGTFEIAGVPAGTHTVRMWHPEFAPDGMTLDVAVEPDGVAAADFTIP